MATRLIVFGEIPGIEEGHWFEGRKEMMPTSFHRNWGAGIDGNGKEGTAAIVLSGGYEDDEDLGDEIIYTGAGGNDPKTGKQVKDQSWEQNGNAGLLKSMDEGLPVRVIRGHTHESEHSPDEGYTYVGLFSVVEAWEETGKSGFKICRFKLVYSGESSVKKPGQIDLDYGEREKKRVQGSIVRIVRDSEIANDVKRLYNYECQVCGMTINTKSGRYVEGAHIKPLGRPHNGDDNPDNLLCLCPNHHVMLDRGVFTIENNFALKGIEGQLVIKKGHILSDKNLKYHREHVFRG